MGMLLTLAMGKKGGGREIGFRFQALESQGSGIYSFGRTREMRLSMVWVVL